MLSCLPPLLPGTRLFPNAAACLLQPLLSQTLSQMPYMVRKSEEEISSQFNTIEDIKGQLVKLDVKKTKIQEDINSIINKMWEEYELTPNAVENYEKPNNISATHLE